MTDKVPWREIPCSEQCWAIYATVRKLHSVVSESDAGCAAAVSSPVSMIRKTSSFWG